MVEFTFTSTIYRWQGASAWHFLDLPTDLAGEIGVLCRGARSGWGSIRVRVSIGNASWSTSIFPDRKRGTYVLPVKAGVRRAEGLGDGSEVEVAIVLTP